MGAGLIAIAFVLLAGAAGGWITVLRPNTLYVCASLLSVTGVVLQDVVEIHVPAAMTVKDGDWSLAIDVGHELVFVRMLKRLHVHAS
jgi:hypothetical protein